MSTLGWDEVCSRHHWLSLSVAKGPWVTIKCRYLQSRHVHSPRWMALLVSGYHAKRGRGGLEESPMYSKTFLQLYSFCDIFIFSQEKLNTLVHCACKAPCFAFVLLHLSVSFESSPESYFQILKFRPQSFSCLLFILPQHRPTMSVK